MITRLVAGAALGLALTTAALPQSYTAPAGIPSALAPGGLEGRAALPNAIDAEGRGRRNDGVMGHTVTDELVTGSLRDARGGWNPRGR